jgi:hypothetical protein
VPANVIPRGLMGIEPLEAGFKKIQIKPQPGPLRQAEITCPTIRGKVFVSFQQDPGHSFNLKVSIPANTKADVYLPNLSNAPKITRDGASVNFEKMGDFVLIRDVGSGESNFEIIK